MWVFGIEGDFSASDVSGCTRFNTIALAGCTDVNWYATVTGRLGIAFDRSLLYVKGGAAFTDEDHFIVSTAAGGGTASTSISNSRTGWTVGAGLEYALWDNWSAKIEYNFMDFGTDNRTMTGVAGGTTNFDIDQQVHVVKFGVNYRFNWGAPVVARY
jgi:outer membrane immunogenic protein